MTVNARSAAILIVVIAAACATGRLISAQRLVDPSLMKFDERDRDPEHKAWDKAKQKPMPTFSSNDRSRWATVRALVDEGTFVVGKRTIVEDSPVDSGIVFEDGWQTVDRVLRPDTQEFHSSKPPFLPTLVAGLYWLLQLLTGWTLKDNPAPVVRTLVFLINVVPFAIYLLVLDRWVGRFAKCGWTRLVVVASAAFATTMTPFLITFNNHVIGTFSVLFALDGVLAIWFGTSKRPALAFAQAGFFAAFAASCELPALAFAAAVFGLLFICDVKRTLLFAAPPALVVAAAFVGTNYAEFGRLRLAYSEFGGEWYEYEGSHWKRPPEKQIGIDWARKHESRAEYAMHVLVGHHGLFSLTPIWILAIVGAMATTRFRHREVVHEPPVGRVSDPVEGGAVIAGFPSTGSETRPTGGRRFMHKLEAPESTESTEPDRLPWPWFLGPLTLALTVVVVGFYLYKSDNYGGWTNGLRWLMWLSPLWLLTMIPVVDRLSTSSWRRGVVYLLLAISVMSAHYTPWNPWQHPWIYDLMKACGWRAYGP